MRCYHCLSLTVAYRQPATAGHQVPLFCHTLGPAIFGRITPFLPSKVHRTRMMTTIMSLALHPRTPRTHIPPRDHVANTQPQTSAHCPHLLFLILQRSCYPISLGWRKRIDLGAKRKGCVQETTVSQSLAMGAGSLRAGPAATAPSFSPPSAPFDRNIDIPMWTDGHLVDIWHTTPKQ